MASFGDPFALELGGAPAASDRVYGALRSAVGEGNRGEEDASIVEAWRMAIARGIAAAVADDRAAFQSSPLTATDALPRLEEMLRYRLAADATDQDRRNALLERHVRRIDPSRPALLSRVRGINPGASFITVSRDTSTETQFGRAFEDHDPSSPSADGPAFNLANGQAGAKITLVPAYSTTQLAVVNSPRLTAGTFSDDDARLTHRIRRLLDEELPAWIDIRIYASCGFALDLDLLDVTAFC
jgi:hypothetical protein